MAEHPHHHPHHVGVESTLRRAAFLTIGFALVEALGGWWTGSLALLSDTGHMLTDGAAPALAAAFIRPGARRSVRCAGQRRGDGGDRGRSRLRGRNTPRPSRRNQ